MAETRGTVGISMEMHTHPPTMPDLSAPTTRITIPLGGDIQLGYSEGDGAGQIDFLYGRRIQATVAGNTLDLRAIVEPWGSDTTITLAKLKFFYAKNRSADTQVYILADSDTLPWGEQTNERLYLRPGALYVIGAPDAAGYAITTGNNTLSFKVATGTEWVDIVLGGVKA